MLPGAAWAEARWSGSHKPGTMVCIRRAGAGININLLSRGLSPLTRYHHPYEEAGAAKSKGLSASDGCLSAYERFLLCTLAGPDDRRSSDVKLDGL